VAWSRGRERHRDLLRAFCAPVGGDLGDTSADELDCIFEEAILVVRRQSEQRLAVLVAAQPDMPDRLAELVEKIERSDSWTAFELKPAT